MPTETPEEGTEDRWGKLADELKDCRAILVTAAGPRFFCHSNPPAAAGRQQARVTDDSEVPVSMVIDQMAKGRGQDRAIRQGRR